MTSSSVFSPFPQKHTSNIYLIQSVHSQKKQTKNIKCKMYLYPQRSFPKKTYKNIKVKSFLYPECSFKCCREEQDALYAAPGFRCSPQSHHDNNFNDHNHYQGIVGHRHHHLHHYFHNQGITIIITSRPINNNNTFFSILYL